MEKEKRGYERGDFSKDRETIKDIGGFRLARGCLRIHQSLRYNNNGEKEKEESKGGGEKRADQSARYLTNTGVCWPPLLPRTNRETIRRIFFFFFYTRTSRIARTTSTIRIAWKTQPRIVENSETSSPASILPPFPSICINERESVGGFSRVCTPCRASIARGGRIKYNAETRTVESCDERERERESFRRPYLFSWDWGECAESSRVWGGVPSRISFSVVR